MARKGWVDFKEVREGVDFGQVLDDYGVEYKSKGDGGQVQAFCPLPGHSGGGKRSPSFSARLTKPFAFQCFSCGAKGNVIDFVALMEGLDPEKMGDVRMAALQLQARYLGREPTQSKAPRRSKARPATKKAAAKPAEDRPRIINAPLDFELKGLDPKHPYLTERNLDAETIEGFGLGYSNRGLMKGRIAIPLHDTEGKLIGYAGRLVDDSQINGEHSKYLFPGSRDRDGTVYEFRKGEFLFNGFRLETPADDILIVEGFFSLFWMMQCGYENIVALMGATCSAKQAELLLKMTKPSSRIWVIPDGDKAGERCAASVLTQTAHQRFVRWIKLAEGQEPEDFYGPSTCSIKDRR